MFTCPPECCSLFVVRVEVLGEGVRLQQTVQQLEEVCRGHVFVHTLIRARLTSLCLRRFESISLQLQENHFSYILMTVQHLQALPVIS